jgi:hypothetical protein
MSNEKKDILPFEDKSAYYHPACFRDSECMTHNVCSLLCGTIYNGRSEFGITLQDSEDPDSLRATKSSAPQLWLYLGKTGTPDHVGMTPVSLGRRKGSLMPRSRF